MHSRHSIIAGMAAALFGDFGEDIARAIERPLELPALPTIKSSGAYGGGKRDLRIRTSKYMPHQSAREKGRRLAQMDAGQLTGRFEWLTE